MCLKAVCVLWHRFYPYNNDFSACGLRWRGAAALICALLYWKLDLTGYGFFEFVGFVFLLSALSYYLLFRLTRHFPNPAIVQLHFWPTLLFGICSIFLAHWVNQFPKEKFDDPTFLPFLNHLLLAFTWAFIAFLAFQLAFAIGAVRQIWRNRHTEASSDITLAS